MSALLSTCPHRTNGLGPNQLESEVMCNLGQDSSHIDEHTAVPAVPDSQNQLPALFKHHAASLKHDSHVLEILEHHLRYAGVPQFSPAYRKCTIGRLQFRTGNCCRLALMDDLHVGTYSPFPQVAVVSA